MATIQHKDLTGAELHEPKGVDAAGAGQIYVADGAGSGNWEPGVVSAYACLRVNSDQTTTGMTTAYQEINNASLGINWSGLIVDPNGKITGDLANGYLTMTEAGTYQMNISLAVRGASSGARHWSFTIGKQVGGAGSILEQSAIIRSYTTANNTSDNESVSLACFPTFAAGDRVYIMARSEGTISEVEIRAINMTFERVG